MLVQPLLALAACAVVALAAPAPQNTPPPSPNITDIYYATEILDACPGYTASNVVQTDSSLTADLTLAGTACNQFGNDLHDLKLVVEYQTSEFCPSVPRCQALAILYVSCYMTY
jgi:alpha-glucosidase